MNNQKKKFALVILLAAVLSTAVTGCGLPKEADLSGAEYLVTAERDEFDRVFSEFEDLENVKAVYFSRGGEHKGNWCMTDADTGAETIINKSDEIYRNIISFLAKHENAGISETPAGFSISGLKDPANDQYFDILRSDESPENVANPYWRAGVDNESMNWKRTVEGNEIHFIADHRKDKESYHRGMYYRIDMRYAGNGIYIYEEQEKYPWYSVFASVPSLTISRFEFA